MPTLSPALQTVLLLFASNIFMTLAWYWHLSSLRTAPLIVAILVSWLIALAEYRSKYRRIVLAIACSRWRS